jgi:capsular polysaccharide biosynthesis protein
VEIDEVAARVARTYWALLLAMTVLPLALVAVLMSGQQAESVATARLEAGGSAADAATPEGGASVVVSQVKAFATGDSLLRGVLRRQGVDRRPQDVAKAVEVTGLGTSTIVELSVRDVDPDVARRLADAVGAQVVVEINDSNQRSIKRQMAALDKRVRELEKELAPLSRRAASQGELDAGDANERDSLQGELTELRSNRSDLRTQLATAGTAAMIQPAVLGPKSNPVVMTSAVAGLVGLIGGIFIAVVAELVRPTIPGQRRVARRLDVPVLGWAGPGQEGLDDLGRRVRLAAAREGVAQVALVGAPGPLPPALVASVASAAHDSPDPDPGDAHDPHDSGGGAAAKASLNGGEESGSGGRAAVMTERSTETAPSRRGCRVRSFEDIDPDAGERAGVVVAVGPVTTVSGLETVRDLVAASGWPVLGVIATTRRNTSRKSRGSR